MSTVVTLYVPDALPVPEGACVLRAATWAGCPGALVEPACRS